MKEYIAKMDALLTKLRDYTKTKEGDGEAKTLYDELLDFIHSKVMGYGYTFTFDSNADKQLKIIKEVSNV